MKKAISVLIILITLIISPLMAANMQKTFSGDSTEYQMAYALCISAGVIPPSSVLPITGAEIAEALSRIPYDKLSLDEKAAYDDLMGRLEFTPLYNYDKFGIDPTPLFSFDAFARSGESGYENDLLFKREDRMEAIDFAFKMKFADVGYGFFNWLQLSPELVNQSITGQHFGTNFDTWFEGKITRLQHEGIFDAGLLFGNDWMNFSIMSGRQEMGYGKTGNLALGDNFRRQQYLRLHTFSRWFDYTYSLTHYGKMQNNDSPKPGDLKMFSNGEVFSLPQQVFPLHRFEFKIADKVQIAVVEGAMMYIESVFDPRILNPFLFIHGFDNYADNWEKPVDEGDEANNILVLELGYTFLPHHRINLQAMSDQIQMGGEKRNVPNALAFLLNYETSWVIDKAYINGYVEGAYVMPAVYLNSKTDKDSKHDHNYDFIAGYPMWGYNEHINGDIDYVGYKYGPDSIVFSLGATCGIPGTFSLDGSLTYVIHGKYGLGYQEIVATRDEAEAAKAFSLPLSDAEHRIEILIKGSYQAIKGLEIKSGIGFVQAWNHLTEKNKNFTDAQFYIGVKFDPVTMFAKGSDDV